MGACSFGRPEDSERGEHYADGENFITRSRERARAAARERRWPPTPATSTIATAAPRACARGMLPCVLPKVTTMNATLSSPSERKLTPLNESVLEAVPVEPCPLAARCLPRLGELSGEDRVLVVQRLEAARPQDGLAQPLQAEDEQQRADEQAQIV